MTKTRESRHEYLFPLEAGSDFVKEYGASILQPRLQLKDDKTAIVSMWGYMVNCDVIVSRFFINRGRQFAQQKTAI
jgi:hypothetical protein